MRKNYSLKNFRWTFLGIALLAVIAGVVALAGAHTTFATSQRVPAPKPGAEDTIRIYISPGATDTNDGLSPANPVKTISRASEIAQEKWNKGLARGDIEVRFANATFPAVAERFKIWTFAPAEGKYVRFLPSWYANDTDADLRPLSDYPMFSGLSNLDNADAPFTVEPTQNKGGSYEFAYLRFQYFNNGILLNGGAPMRDADALDSSQVDYGVRRGLNAPIKNPIFRNLTFENMGSKYAPNHGNSFGSVRPWNTVGALVSNVSFKNLDEDPRTMSIHAVYGYHSYDAVIENSTFDTVLSDPIRYRDGGGWTVRNNTFIRAGYISNVSQWFAHKELDETYVDDSGPNMRRFSECSGEQATGTAANNTTDGLDYNGNNYYTSYGQQYPFEFQSTRTYDEPEVCNDPSRVYAPSTSGRQTGEGRYLINWTTPRTLSGSVARYHIYKGDTNDNKGQLVATVDAGGANSYELSNLPAEKDLYYYVIAEGTAGGFSPRTDNRRWMNLVPYVISSTATEGGTLAINDSQTTIDQENNSLADTGIDVFIIGIAGISLITLGGLMTIGYKRRPTK